MKEKQKTNIQKRYQRAEQKLEKFLKTKSEKSPSERPRTKGQNDYTRTIQFLDLLKGIAQENRIPL